MALNYLLSPEFQICTSSGKPATNGYIEVYIHGTRDKYYCALDWNGTLHPFRIPLDSLGSNVVLADDGRSYDVYIYNRYGSLLMSRYNVHPASGGGIGSNITSSDGTIEITPTETGVDLSVKGAEPSVLIAGSAARTSDGAFAFTPIKRTGTEITVSPQNKVMLDSGWYHYDIALTLDWDGILANAVNIVTVSTSAGDHEYGIDLSYAHSETVHISGEFHATDDATEFVVSIADLPVGTTATVYDLGMHSIKGVGGASSGQFEQKQADWTQTDGSDPSFIQHKPEVKTVVQGDNIIITEGESTFTISADLSSCTPKVKYRKTTVQHTITAADVTQEKSAFSDPILMPSDYSNKTVAIVNLFGTIMTTDTSAVPNSFIIWVDFDSAHSSGSEVLSTNFITADNYQVNFSANIQLPFASGAMHPSGLYLDIWRHGLPADSTISVTAEVTVLDRE